MTARFLKFGEPPPTYGGDVEREVARAFLEGLPDNHLILGSPSFPTKSGYFYEYDLVLLSPFLCDVIEIKHRVPAVTVYEDTMQTEGGDLELDAQLFSKTDRKAAVLADRLSAVHFLKGRPRVNGRIVLGKQCQEIRFAYKDHQAHKLVLRVDDAVEYYADAYRRSSKGKAPKVLEKLHQDQVKHWQGVAQSIGVTPARNRLGRFQVLRALGDGAATREYEAIDEAPCRVKVHLREFPFDPLLRGKDLEEYLRRVTGEMQVLRRLRHPSLCCVTGHFRTGSSLVQVSDWFDGRPVGELFVDLAGADLTAAGRLMGMVVEGLAYCHEKGVFHRHINAEQVLVSPNWDEVRLTGFEFAKDLDQDRTRTATWDELQRRDVRLVPPEERVWRKVEHYGRYDVYQLGVLFYRMLEGGEWPWPERAAIGAETFRPLQRHTGEPGIEAVRQLVVQMLAESPNDRPFPMGRVEALLRQALEGGGPC